MMTLVPEGLTLRTMFPSPLTLTPCTHFGLPEASETLTPANLPPDVSTFAPPFGHTPTLAETLTTTFVVAPSSNVTVLFVRSSTGAFRVVKLNPSTAPFLSARLQPSVTVPDSATSSVAPELTVSVPLLSVLTLGLAPGTMASVPPSTTPNAFFSELALDVRSVTL